MSERDYKMECDYIKKDEKVLPLKRHPRTNLFLLYALLIIIEIA
jgi:hypothetical protein